MGRKPWPECQLLAEKEDKMASLHASLALPGRLWKDCLLVSLSRNPVPLAHLLKVGKGHESLSSLLFQGLIGLSLFWFSYPTLTSGFASCQVGGDKRG